MQQVKALMMILVVFWLGACSTPGTSTPDPTPEPDPLPEVELECGGEDYPCTFAEVDDAIMLESLSLLDAIWLMHREGASMENALAYIEE